MKRRLANSVTLDSRYLFAFLTAYGYF